MHQTLNERVVDLNPQETAEWVEALDQIVEEAGRIARRIFWISSTSGRGPAARTCPFI